MPRVRALCGMHTTYFYTCVLILTTIYGIRVRALCGIHAGVYICVLIPLYVSSYLCIYVSSYLCGMHAGVYICVDIPLYVSSYLMVSSYLCIYASSYLCGMHAGVHPQFTCFPDAALLQKHKY